jgi:hypothetical protein
MSFLSGVNHIFFQGPLFSLLEDFRGKIILARLTMGYVHFWKSGRCSLAITGMPEDFAGSGLIMTSDLFPDFRYLEAKEADPGDQALDVHYFRRAQRNGFGQLARALCRRGYTFDYVADGCYRSTCRLR